MGDSEGMHVNGTMYKGLWTMSLIGPFYNAVNDDENIYDINILTPGSIALGVVPEEYILEEIKAIVTTPAPAGTSFKVIDQNSNIIIPAGRLIVDRVVSSAAAVNKRTTLKLTLTGVFEGPAAGSPAEFVLIKKIWRIP